MGDLDVIYFNFIERQKVWESLKEINGVAILVNEIEYNAKSVATQKHQALMTLLVSPINI